MLLSGTLTLLILLSAFFSCAETALMAVNRYRLRHRARMKKRYALLILNLLKRPDRLLGLILIGNSVSNIFAASLATLIAIAIWGPKAVVLSSFLLTLIILVLAEVAPKTVAALYPDQVSRLLIWPVFILLKIFYPLVWLVNGLSNGLLWLVRVNLAAPNVEPLSREELRSIVYETTGKISHQYQNMLVSILDLNKVIVKDIMIPRHRIVGIDLSLDWNEIKEHLAKYSHGSLPVYRENINSVLGILQIQELMGLIFSGKEINNEMIAAMLHEPYFIPEGTSLNAQLLNFQNQHKRMALVVDEYGEIQGLISLEDILEEIVGEFNTQITTKQLLTLQPDGSYLVDGAITIRELNRLTKWRLPIRGPKTLSGLIIEYLESIPHAGTSIKIRNYPIEIVSVKENRVKMARLYKLTKKKS